MASLGSALEAALGTHQNHLQAAVATGNHLDVRQFSVHERMSALFQVSLVAHSDNHDVDFDAVVGKPASFTILTVGEPRSWSGVCNHLQQIGVAERGLATYELSIVPTLWFASQRRNHRMFQHLSEPNIVLRLLKEWGVEPDVRIDKGAYKKRKYRVQYGETDFAFICRMLEDAGVSFYFEQHGAENKLVLADAPQKSRPRARPIPFTDSPSGGAARGEQVSAVRFGQQVRPGKVTVRDHDYRLPPAYKLIASATGGDDVEARLERFHYTPGAFLFGTDKGDGTPSADDRGKTRTDEAEAALLAQRRLDANRVSARVYTFDTNVLDLSPGVVMHIDDYPRADLTKGSGLLVVETSMAGAAQGESHCHCEARRADQPYRPPLVTPRPTTQGVESATVVGPKGEEIHTDEFGRVRVHFHWDRESAMDEKSSCWIHVSQSWGGAGYGGSNLPRVGQEVLVDFLGGDPDRPVITGRVYTNLQKTPYKLPDNKTQSGWKSNSTGGGGGYNEIMFEDAEGQELLRMQAEKDLHKLVKNDEQHTVGRNRTRRVKGNEEVTVQKNRTMRVKLVETETIGLAQVISVGLNRVALVGVVDQTMVGAMHLISVGSAEGDGATTTLMVPQKIVLDTGAGASISMEGGNIVIQGESVQVLATNGDVLIQGGPLVKINP